MQEVRRREEWAGKMQGLVRERLPVHAVLRLSAELELLQVGLE